MIAMTISAFLLLSTMMAPTVHASIASGVGEIDGPHFNEIMFKIYPTQQDELKALTSGDVDLVDFFNSSLVKDIQPELATGSLTTIQNAEEGFSGFSIQCESYPCNLTKFRQAISYLVDKDKDVAQGLGGLGYKIDTILGSPSYGQWAGKTYTTYGFDPSEAARILDSLGFVKGADGKRIDPKSGATMRPLIIIASNEQQGRIYAATQLSQQLNSTGIPNELDIQTRAAISSRVFNKGDYDIYASSWTGGPDVDWVYDLLYSASQPTLNIERFKNSTVDSALSKLRFGSTLDEVMAGAQETQKLISEQCPIIPIYADAYTSVYSTRLRNVVDAPWWLGAANPLTFLTAQDKSQKYGSTLNVGWSSDLVQPSPMYQTPLWWDSMLTGIVYDTPLRIDPKTLAELPWLAKSWEVEPWVSGNGKNGLKITFNLNSGIKWQDGQPLTSSDLVFTWDYARREQNPVYASYLQNYVRGEAPDTHTAVAYMNTTSYWSVHYLGEDIPVIPEHIWKNIKDSASYQPIKDATFIGSGPYEFKAYTPGDRLLVVENPDYFLKPGDSQLSHQTITLTQGETRTFNRTTLIHGEPIVNGTFDVTITKPTGEAVKTVSGKPNSSGNYTAKLETAGLEPGEYMLVAEFHAPVGDVGLGSSEYYNLVITAGNKLTLDFNQYEVGLGVVALASIVVYVAYRMRKKPKPDDK